MTDSGNSAIPRRIIDTNIIIRFLIGDVKNQAAKARRLFMDAEAGLVALVIPEVVLVEVVHVLYKTYKLEKSSITHAIRSLARYPGVETLTPLEVVIAGIENFESTNAPWPDALSAVYASRLGMPEVYSFDAHLDKFDGIVKLQPLKIDMRGDFGEKAL
jgi:predicted nucleic acid-binding protein